MSEKIRCKRCGEETDQPVHSCYRRTELPPVSVTTDQKLDEVISLLKDIIDELKAIREHTR